MVRRSHVDPHRVREEIAIAAARLIAEEGLDYASAKRKAARQVVGQARIAGEWLPDNDQIEEEIREYQALFQADSQPAVLRRLREFALDWMKRLAAFNPYLTGAVLNGTAGEHSDVHLQVFCDNPKEVAIYLLNANVQYDVSETRHFGGRGTILGTALGVVTIQLLKNGLQLAGFRGEATVVLIGTVLILSILLNQFLEKFVLSGRSFFKLPQKPESIIRAP